MRTPEKNWGNLFLILAAIRRKKSRYRFLSMYWIRVRVKTFIFDCRQKYLCALNSRTDDWATCHIKERVSVCVPNNASPFGITQFTAKAWDLCRAFTLYWCLIPKPKLIHTDIRLNLTGLRKRNISPSMRLLPEKRCDTVWWKHDRDFIFSPAPSQDQRWEVAVRN